MHVSRIDASGFRCFGPDSPLSLNFPHVPNIVVRPNDFGKTAIIDAPRLVLWTRGANYHRLEPGDFHVKADCNRVTELFIRCTFESLTLDEEAGISEWCSNEAGTLRLEACPRASRRKGTGGSEAVISEYRAGRTADRPAPEGVGA